MQKQPLSPADQMKADILSLQSELRTLIEQTKLTRVRDETSRLESSIANLPVRIRKVRVRKFAFNKLLEKQAIEYQRQWATKKGTVHNHLSAETNRLQVLLRQIENRTTSINPRVASPVSVANLKNEMANFKTKVSASEKAISELYDELKREVTKTESELGKIEQTLEYCDSASFGFLPAESVVAAVKATWTRDDTEDKDDPEGILFLTDQRLIFEQREEVATKKVLFVTTERKLVQQLLFEVPVFSVAGVKSTNQGLFKNEDWLELELESGAFARSAKLHLDGQESDTWQQLISLAKSRELDADRALEIDQEAEEKVKAAPVQCPYCGGAIIKPVLRGMDTITCDYCGGRIKI